MLPNMPGVRARGEQVRNFIVANVEAHPSEIASIVSETFGISRQAAHKHLRRLVEEQFLTVEGRTQNLTYKLVPLFERLKTYPIAGGLDEGAVWLDEVKPFLSSLPDNVQRIWHYGFTEMLNNAVDHSEGQTVSVRFRKTAATTEIVISDDGIGIFRKIQAALGLLDERHSVLELAKGKFTTDPSRHSGQGIFFTSRMFDDFQILSGGVYFSHEFSKKEDWILKRKQAENGTHVFMNLNNHTSRTARKVFDQFASDDNYGFTKTIVPVGLAQYGDDNLVSRSQAKRLLSRVERFKTVVLDFKGVESVGQAFADEVFRVFLLQHPGVELIEINATSEVQNMIARARTHTTEGQLALDLGPTEQK
jgi:anti-sigma regulatory factor (Ser/Thr protein kinase)